MTETLIDIQRLTEVEQKLSNIKALLTDVLDLSAKLEQIQNSKFIFGIKKIEAVPVSSAEPPTVNQPATLKEPKQPVNLIDRTPGKVTPKMLEQIKFDYVDGKSVSAIANKLGLAAGTVSYHIKKMGISALAPRVGQGE